MKTILLLLLASLTFSRLLTPRSFDNLKIYKDDGVKAGDLKTTCTNPKPTEDFDKT